MSVCEPNSRHLREIIFCFNMKKSAAEAHWMLSNTYGEAAISERTCRDFNASRTVILMSKTGIAEERRFPKMQNWRHYLSKTRVKIKKNWHDHWEWLNKPFQNSSKPWEWFRSKKIGSYELKPRDVERRLFVCEQLLERQRRKGFLHRIVRTKNGFITIIPSAENHGEFPAMLPRRWPNRIFTPQNHALYLVGARRSVLWTVKTDWNNHRRSVSNAIDAFEPSIERQTAAIQRETR